jgi:hypothetical protein
MERDRLELWRRLLFRAEDDGFGRDYWIPGKGRASSLNMLLTLECFPKWYNAVKDQGYAWVSVCYYALETDEKMNLVCRPKCFDMIVYDLDIPLPKEECVKLRAEDPKRFQQLLSTVRSEALRLYHHLAKRYKCTPLLNFTGNRGYQLWLLLEKPLPALHYRMAFHYYIAGLTFGRELDPNVTDPARFMRLPYTRHEQGGLCLPLDPQSLEPLRLEQAVETVKPAPVNALEELISLEPISIPKKLVIGRSGKRSGRRRLPEDPVRLLEDMAPPCLKAIWGKLREKREISHSERLALAWFLQNLGYNDDAIVGLFKNAPDFNEKKTRYYLKRSRKPDGTPKYRMYKCSTMKNLNMCLDCGYGRNPVSWTLRRV